MSSHSFEKPKDWGVAPQSQWVSGSPIGQSEVKMPSLGDPGSHENASERVSFGAEGAEREGAMFRGRMVEQCPPGFTNQNGVCVADPESSAKPESRFKALTRGQWGGEDKDKVEGYRPGKVDPSFERELPKAPMRGTHSRRGGNG